MGKGLERGQSLFLLALRVLNPIGAAATVRTLANVKCAMWFLDQICDVYDSSGSGSILLARSEDGPPFSISQGRRFGDH